MAMSNRNTRAVHTDHKRIKNALADHLRRMNEYVAKGWDKENASRQAFKDMNPAKEGPHAELAEIFRVGDV